MSAEGAAAADRLRVDLGARSYDILVGAGLLADAGSRLEPILGAGRTVIVTDERVAGLYLDALAASLDRAGIAHRAIVLPVGEQTKSFRQLEKLVDSLLEAEIERSATLLALGGGVVGDLAGFAASIVLRGIGYVQLPTTLLAQVDSSVGGKTGINTRQGKNLAGSFYQPRMVLADTDTLDTLEPRQLRAGYAEVVKYGLIGDRDFFGWLEANGQGLLDGDGAARHHAVVTCCAAKAAIVADDEREAGRRALLNLGHTFAHTLEAETGYSDELLHGEAVAVGMALAFDLSARLGLCQGEDAARVRRHLAAVGLPTDLRSGRLGRRPLDAQALIERMRLDKKVRDGKITFVLARGIGEAFLTDDVDLGALRACLDGARAA